MARIGRPGSIRGEARARGVSEYRIRVEREEERATREGRSPSLPRAAGKGSYERQRDLRKLYKLISPNFPPGTPAYKEIRKAVRYTYDHYGFDETQGLLVLQGLNTHAYLGGYPNMIVARRPRKTGRYSDIPEAMYWYHGVLA